MSNHFETLARFGYAARGLVYLLLGGLALASAVWGGTGADGSSDALSTLLGLPFGRVLLGLVALGLVGHILWRLAQGLLDADNAGDDAKGYAGRIGSVISAGANVFLALSAARMALVGAGGGGGGGEQDASAWLLQQPFGAFLLGLAALGVIGAGVAQIAKGVTQDYRKRLTLPSAQSRLLDPVCRFGLASRGALIVIIGGFVLYAAITVSPERAGGTSAALDYVHALPFGPIIYGLAALGLVAFGAYSVVQGLYRRMSAPGISDIKRVVPGV